jgi:nucleoid DNA-binding protein
MTRSTKTDIAGFVAEELGMQRSAVTKIIDEFFIQVATELEEGNEVVISGNLKFGFRVRKAVKKGTLVYNPATQEKQPSAGKPASIVVVVRPLKNLKTAAPDAKTKIGKEILAGTR